MKFTVALLQIAASGNDQSRNLAKGLQFCREAKALGADLAVFPELWNIGFTRSPIDFEARQLWAGSAIDQRSTFFQSFATLARELDLNIAITYLEAHQPMPRNTVSIIDRRGEVMLNYSRVFICDFGKEELLKPKPNVHDIGCDVNCSPGELFDVCTLIGAKGQVKIGAMVCADREFPEAASQLMLNGAELIVVPNACTWDDIRTRTAGLKTSPNVSPRGRVAAKSSSIRRRRQVKIRESSYRPSSAVLLAVFAPRVPIFGQGKIHHSTRLVVLRNGLATCSLQQRRAATCNCRCTWRNSAR